MADSTISALTAGSALTGTELFEGVQSGSKKFTSTQVRTFAQTGFTAGSVLFAATGTGAISQDNANLFWDDTLKSMLVKNPSSADSVTAAYTVHDYNDGTMSMLFSNGVGGDLYAGFDSNYGIRFTPSNAGWGEGVSVTMTIPSYPSQPLAAFSSDVTGYGDNSTFQAKIAVNGIARDPSDVAIGTKSALYAGRFAVYPLLPRNNVPFDDVAGIIIGNESPNGSIGTDALFFDNDVSFGTNPAWGTLISADANAGYVFRATGRYTHGFDLTSATLTTDAFASPGYLVSQTGQVILTPPASAAALGTNGQLTFQATSNTSLTFKYRGSDGTTRSGSITLS